MGHQEACDFRCRKSDNIHYEPQKNQYIWCTSCNNGNGAWGYHWEVVHMEWKENQAKYKSVHFSDPATNAVIYCSYLMTTSDKYVKE